jgi:DNA-binding transcriptional LysR family regulator
VELREVQTFLILAEQLHFGRTAERLGLTQSRVSQVLRSLERKLGGQLLHRTSRQVTLTPLGRRLLTELGPAYDQLTVVLARIQESNRRLEGVLRLGIYGVAGGQHMAAIIDAFETHHPACELQISELSFPDPLGPIRGGLVDVLAMRLPIDRPDLTVGPILSREPRVLAVARDHPLADRARVSIEDVADYQVAPLDGPEELIEEFVPRRTPSGRPIRRARHTHSPYEVVTLIARGKIVHPTVPSFAAYAGHPNLVYIPLTGMKPSRTALVWRRGTADPRLREFVRITRAVLRAARTPSTGATPNHQEEGPRPKAPR